MLGRTSGRLVPSGQRRVWHAVLAGSAIVQLLQMSDRALPAGFERVRTSGTGAISVCYDSGLRAGSIGR